jgi:hypothetical protein
MVYSQVGVSDPAYNVTRCTFTGPNDTNATAVKSGEEDDIYDIVLPLAVVQALCPG